MYKKIMVPVDLTHIEQLDKALATAADLSKQYAIPICYVGVAAAAPGAVAHDPAEFAEKLKQFEKLQAQAHGLPAATSAAFISHDPAVDLDATLLKAIQETGADLVVMASHIPGFPDYLFGSNAAYIAAHAKVSVMVIRH
jgi:nucleotide-binding universal stress UspA family protein